MKKIIVTLFAITLFCNVALAIEVIPKPLNINEQLKIAPQIIFQENPSQGTQIKLHFPQITGKNISQNALKFNQLVKSIIEPQVEKFKQDAKTLARKSPHNTLSLNYQVYLINAGKHQIISILFSFDSMIAKYAHPIHTMQALNYDFTTAKPLMLSDLFEPHSGYRMAIASYCKAALKRKFPDGQFFETGIVPTPENYSIWNLRASDIIIHFNEAQVVPRIYGSLQVAVPYDPKNGS